MRIFKHLFESKESKAKRLSEEAEYKEEQKHKVKEFTREDDEDENDDGYIPRNDERTKKFSKPGLTIQSGPLVAFALTWVLVLVVPTCFRSTLAGLNVAFFVYCFLLTFGVLAVYQTVYEARFWASCCVFPMHLLISIAIGFTLAFAAHLHEKWLGGTNQELIQSWQSNDSTVRLYRNNGAPPFVDPSIEVWHERIILPYVMIIRRIDIFTGAREADCTIDPTGVLHIYVPPLKDGGSIRERTYQLKPWVRF